MSQYKIEDFVIGTTFILSHEWCEVISENEAIKIRAESGCPFTTLYLYQDVAHFFAKDKTNYSWLIPESMLDDLRDVKFPGSSGNAADSGVKHTFVEDKEKQASSHYNFDCPKCNKKSEARLSLVTESYVCLLCNQSTALKELRQLDCSHRGKQYKWYSAQTGIRSGCYDCRLREESFDD